MNSTITLDEIRKEIESLPDLSRKALDSEAKEVMRLAAKKNRPTEEIAKSLRLAGYAFSSADFRIMYRDMKSIS